MSLLGEALNSSLHLKIGLHLWMKLITSFTKNNRHHVGTEDSPDEVRDEMLAHIGLEDQDKLVESTIKRVLRNLEQLGWWSLWEILQALFSRTSRAWSSTGTIYVDVQVLAVMINTMTMKWNVHVLIFCVKYIILYLFSPHFLNVAFPELKFYHCIL